MLYAPCLFSVCQRFPCVMAGWFLAAAPLGGFGREARGGRAGAAALAAAKCWAVGVPVRMHNRVEVLCISFESGPTMLKEGGQEL